MKKTIALLVLGSTLMGCTAINTAIEHRNLDVQTRASSTIFLPPVSSKQKTIYIQIKNTSDKSDFKVASQVKDLLRKKGYRVVTKVDNAHYLLQANILQVGRTTPEKARGLLSSGYGSALGGFAVGALASSAVGSNVRTGVAVGLVGALVGTVANSMVKDVFYSVVTDVQVSERSDSAVETIAKATLKQGNSNEVIQRHKSKIHWQRYQTRVMSSAEKVNLDFAEAKPKLETGLSQSLVGIF